MTDVERPPRPAGVAPLPVRDQEEPRGTSFFVRTVVGWDAAFWAMLVITVLIVLGDDLQRAQVVTGLGLSAVLGLAYAVVGRPAIRSRNRHASHAYLVVLVVVVSGLVLISPRASFLLFIAFAQTWVFSERIREGVTYTLLLVVGLAAAELTRSGWSGAVLGDNLPWWGISLLVSLVFGTWVSKIIDESEQRADLITTLDRTRAELAEANHAAGVVAERERLAREIHDTLAQGFTGIVTLAAAAQARLATGGADEVAARLATIEDIARENLAEARALVAAFSPVALDDTTLADALRRLAVRFETETGVAVDVAVDADDHEAGPPPAHQVVLLRVVQEALANVGKHARASRVTITLTGRADGWSAVEVTDDGTGFVPAAVATHGFGLAGMRGRVEEAGGALRVESAPGAGTLVHVQIPAVVAR